jgi:hypothetical protein
MEDEILEASLIIRTSTALDRAILYGMWGAISQPDLFSEFHEFDREMASARRQATWAGRLPDFSLENPLLRSGLALAGANVGLREPPDATEEDGLLTAEDVMGLNLEETELVVLSACDTGLGEVRTGEGVFGLRRAFQLAGAKTLVMSLWKVPDVQTEKMMVEFYRRLGTGVGRAEALRHAQLEMKREHPHPLTWGAFICQGHPGPIDLTNIRPAQPRGRLFGWLGASRPTQSP